MKLIVGLVTFCLAFIIPKVSNLGNDGYIKIGRPFVYYWETNAKTIDGINQEFILQNLILNIVIYCFFLIFLLIILKKNKKVVV